MARLRSGSDESLPASPFVCAWVLGLADTRARAAFGSWRYVDQLHVSTSRMMCSGHTHANLEGGQVRKELGDLHFVNWSDVVEAKKVQC